MRRTLVLWLPVLAWASIVFYLSSIPNLRAVASNFWDEIIRSGAHFGLYGLGYFLFFRALNGNFVLALILTIVYAISDETHQLFVPTRSFQWRDLLVDFSGTIVSLFLTNKACYVKNISVKILRLAVIFLGFVVLSSFVSRIFAQDSLERKIVVFKPEVSQPERLSFLSRHRVTLGKELRLINAAAVRISPLVAERLTRDSRVLRIDPDVEVYALPRYRPKPTPTPTVAVSQTIPWGILKINADDVWQVSSGSGVKVAVIDTGIDRDHPDLDENLAGCLNFIQSWKTCEDDNGHGTHVSGIIAAENNNLGVVGVAPSARLYALKVLNSQGSGYLSDIIEALDWAVVNKMQVVNMSLGTSSNVLSFQEAVQRANAAGIIQVAAAGNSGPADNTVLYPAKYPEVIAVAATDASNQVPPWSSRGPEVDLAAPGVSIYSTYKGNTYKTLSGTSMAAPHVAGVVALRLEDHPGDSPTTMELILEANADAGLVDAYSSLKN